MFDRCDRYYKLLGVKILVGLLAVSCAGEVKRKSDDLTSSPPFQEAAIAPDTESGSALINDAATLPQLVKTARINIIVDSVEKSISVAIAIAKRQGGDVLLLRENQPQNSSPHQATLELRVPQENLETTLDELNALGSTVSRILVAEDVGDRIVDFDSRLRNLRKAEETLLEIMERSGSMEDVLAVARELNTTRSQIEQIDGQLQDLRNRVAFSTITIGMEARSTSLANELDLEKQLQATWKNATHSLVRLTAALLNLGLWLVVYSPYLAIIGGVSWLVFRWRKRQ